MGLIRFAMGRPVTVMVAVLSLVMMAILAITRMKVDIFPTLNLPRVTVIQPYGGMDPGQIEGYCVSFYEQHFFYISGVDHVSSKSIQSAAEMDIYFQPDTDMADAMAQVVAQVERSRAYMPPGTVTPFIIRFDVGSVPVGFLVFDCKTKSLGEIQDLVYARVRPIVATIPGVSTPPPFGGNQRSIVLTVDARKLMEYHLSGDDIVTALNENNTIMPSGIVRTGDLQRMSSINSVVGNIQNIGTIPISRGEGPAVYIRDVARIEDSTDINTGYALVNGKRTIYMAISKQASSSTVAVVDGVKENVPYMQSQLPEDIKVAFVFDQSVYVTQALQGLLVEGGLGAILTGGVVLLFLQDLRSSLIVVLNIPFALLSAVFGLWIGGQTINIMTLSGLSLAVGILVDEATVTIENIHSHLAKGVPLTEAIWDASLEVVIPRLLAMLSVVSVFMPSFLMVGVTQSLFVPLSMAVGLAMFSSYILSGTFVPAIASWLLKPHKAGEHDEEKGLMAKVRRKYRWLLTRFLFIKPVIFICFALLALSSFVTYPMLGRELFPAGNPNTFQLRVKAPTGTRFEITEVISRKILDIIAKDAGDDNVDISIGYVGTQPPSYAISNVYMWTSGPEEAILMVQLKESAKITMRDFQEKLRHSIAQAFPNVEINFEAGDIVNKIINLGSPTPVQVDIAGPNFDKDQEYTQTLLAEMKKISYLRDVGIVQPLNYPTLRVDVDRIRAGQLNTTVHEVGRALIAATYSSRFVSPIYWVDSRNGLAYQVQVQVPQGDIDSIASVGAVRVKGGEVQGPYLRDLAQVHFGVMPGEYDHYNMKRMISIAANIQGSDLGKAAELVEKAIKNVGAPPRGVKVNLRGQVPIMRSTFFSFQLGVCFAVVAIFLMLVAFFQSVRLSLIIISVVPTILAGSLLALVISHTTLNVQSFMGSIMAVGVGVANSILVVVFAEERRMTGLSARTAASTGAAARLRPVLMTSIAMISGMVPMALGMSEGGDRTAPLGRAVIGGLLVSTCTVLLVLPLIYATAQKKANRKSASVLPKKAQEGFYPHQAPSGEDQSANDKHAAGEHKSVGDQEKDT